MDKICYNVGKNKNKSIRAADKYLQSQTTENVRIYNCMPKNSSHSMHHLGYILLGDGGGGGAGGGGGGVVGLKAIIWSHSGALIQQ